MVYVLTTGKFIVATAGIAGGFGGAIKAKKEFFRKNKAAQFESGHLAKTNLRDAMLSGFLKAGSQSLIKYGTFSVFYLLSTMTVENYRNKISVWEHAASGAVLGGLTKINYGLAGFAVAGVLGGIFGLVAGGVITMSLGAGGMTMDEFRCLLHEDHYLRLQEKRLKEKKEAA